MQKKPTKKGPFSGFGIYIIFALILVGSFFFINNLTKPEPPKVLSIPEYEELIFSEELNDSKINVSLVTTDTNMYNFKVYQTVNGKKNVLTYNFYVESDNLADLSARINYSKYNIDYAYVPKSGVSFWDILSILLPIAMLIILGLFIFRSMSGGGANKQAFDFAKSRARLSSSKSITFKDVAGCDEEKQELEEIIDFLKNPKKYVEIGARVPKGVLLVGAPGTGKTLLAKAVSGEAHVPFFSISGSDFVEMFVGVGASRVRDLFKVAKENSPCIIFIDEIDAVGRQRGAGMGGGHDEREQTLNQLLVEMDGFNPNSGIIMMAATNRPDVLDPALLRPGRFDRQITIDLPDVNGREAILKVHARNKQLEPEVNFKDVSKRIPGFSGADIENLLNEAALLAARSNRKIINLEDIDEAMDRVMLGPAKRSRTITEKERKIIAYHEAGHAVIGLKLEGSNVVQKVTIVARGQAGGYNLMVPENETFLESKTSLLARITGYLGGRVAEEIVFKDVTTGAYADFQTATKIARAMVTEYGMSELGPIQYESNTGNVFLGRDYLKEKNFSDQIALEIDKEVRHIVTQGYDQAYAIITKNRKLLDDISFYLLEMETLTKQDIDEIVETGKLLRHQKKNGNGENVKVEDGESKEQVEIKEEAKTTDETR